MDLVFPPATFQVTNEEVAMLHNSDRQLFTQLSVHLGRNLAESVQVLALWLWLERARHCSNLVHQILLLPLTLVSAMAEEAVMILTCIEHDDFLPDFLGMDIELTHHFALNNVSLIFFHAIRMTVVRGVTELVNEVCSRAFEDILEYFLENNNRINHQNSILGLPRIVREAVVGYVPYVESGHDINFSPNVGVPQNVVLSNSPVGPRAFMRRGLPRMSEISRAFNGGYNLTHQRQIIGTELSELLENITLNDDGVEEEEEIVPADDRTIFLTFSKGYPITEIEVHNFIARRYGRDCIEAIFMQDVLPDEQSLFARLVLKSESTISLVLGGQNRAKFSINGKHVWARKYVKRQPHQTQGPTSSHN